MLIFAFRLSSRGLLVSQGKNRACALRLEKRGIHGIDMNLILRFVGLRRTYNGNLLYQMLFNNHYVQYIQK